MGMKIPKFPFAGKTQIAVSVSSGINEGGAPIALVIFEGGCHFDEKSKTVRGGDGIFITLSGIAIIDGDIAPAIEKISGHAVIGSSTNAYKIHNCHRIKDLSGTVHHTELELI